jgi:hypothetical protein
MKSFKKTRSGVSLLISLVLISIVMVFALGISNLVTSSLRQTANVNRSNQAFFAAEGALESGLLANQNMGAGYTVGSQPVSLNCPTDQVCPTANVTVQGKVQDTRKYGTSMYPWGGMYGLPAPGTGNVGSDCSPLTAYYDKAFDWGGTSYAAFEHPCNWNRLKVGESVSIPLYTTTTDSSAGANCTYDTVLHYFVCNPKNIGLTKMVLRVRTPCVDGSEFCTFMGRYDLDVSKGDPLLKGNDTILAWQITATSMDHKTTYTLKPNSEYDRPTGIRKTQNSEIYEGRINYARSNSLSEPYKVLQSTMNLGVDIQGKIGLISDFIRDEGLFPRAALNDKINQPVLKLTMVHTLDASTGGTAVPYLEYQLLTDNSVSAPADTSQTITAEGISGTFKQVLEVKQPQESGLLEYVIQQ